MPSSQRNHRPALTELRELAKSRQIDAVVAYDPDRLSRNFVHLMVLANEFEQQGIELSFVTQNVGRTLEDRMLFGMKGLFAEYERTKIRERTMRGMIARAKSGRLTGGKSTRLYGYRYLPGKGVGEGKRYEKEEEANCVREMFRWLVEEGLSTNAIVFRMRELGVPTPSGQGIWRRSTVHRILRNPAYTGKTWAFTQTLVPAERHFKPVRKHRNTHALIRPHDQWVEIPDATPAIITEDLFSKAQARLVRNKELAPRNARRQYLLSGYVFCKRCGRRYCGSAIRIKINGELVPRRTYRCPNYLTINTTEPCRNRIWTGDILRIGLGQGRAPAVEARGYPDRTRETAAGGNPQGPSRGRTGAC